MCGKYFFYGLQNIYRMNVDTIRYFRDKTYPFKTGTIILFNNNIIYILTILFKIKSQIFKYKLI